MTNQDSTGGGGAAAEAGAGEASGPPPPPGPILLLVRRLFLILVLPVLSAVYLWQAMTVELPSRELIVSPRGFPTLVGVLMVVVTVAMSVAEVGKLRRSVQARAAGAEPPAGTDDDDADRITSWRDAWVTLGSLVAYVLLFPVLGFLVATGLFLAGLSTYLTPRSWLRNLIVAALFAGGVHFVFDELLGVRLPAGVLSGVL